MIEPDDNRTRRQLQKNSLTTMDEHKKNDMKENHNERLSLPTQRGDVTVDPVNDALFFPMIDRSIDIFFSIL